MPHRHSSWRFCTASWFILTSVMPGIPFGTPPIHSTDLAAIPCSQTAKPSGHFVQEGTSTVKKTNPYQNPGGGLGVTDPILFWGARLWRHAHLCLLEASGKVLAGEQAMQARRSPKPEAFSWRWRRERAREVFLESESTFQGTR